MEGKDGHAVNGLWRNTDDGMLFFFALFALLLPRESESKDGGGGLRARSKTIRRTLARLSETLRWFNLTPKQANYSLKT
jgi:hypothetical protein